ncbi:MAG: PepSY-associated TM helix domain-containing protein [Nostoc sp. ChiSLP01]|nr:PepSY-associated TM helix domain-containing protein [Nostoc sp. CmiSLP01]MDZ8282315.1 PepSY-associated TM helix domain-containing protein [Nostoc sp. ChiSLP01]
MKSRKFRDITFILHRYIGLAVGVLIAFISLTGSLLVFKPEIEQLLISQRIGRILPQEQMVSIDRVLETVNSAIYTNNPFNIDASNFTLYSIRLPATASSPYQADFFDLNNKLIRLFVHPYTGEIISWNDADSSFERIILYLHYNLMLGRNGQIAVGIVGLLLLILCITGLILWPGWRKLIAGFKIKWNGHPKRVNFDLHKLVGIIATIFLSFTAFTGFCWNLSDWTYPLIYAITFTPQPPEVSSKPISDSTPLQLSQLLQNSKKVFPNARTFSVSIPSKPEDAVYISKRQNHETMFYGESGVYLDWYSGQILRIVDSTKLSLGDRAIASFVPLHYGTFWGLTSRILYVLVGLTPTILLITGFIMWQYRRKPKSTNYRNDMARVK